MMEEMTLEQMVQAMQGAVSGDPLGGRTPKLPEQLIEEEAQVLERTAAKLREAALRIEAEKMTAKTAAEVMDGIMDDLDAEFEATGAPVPEDYVWPGDRGK